MRLASISLLAAIELLELHGADKQTVYINPAEVSSLRQPTSTDLQHYFPKHVNCVVVTTNGKFYATIEGCRHIRDMLTH